MCRGGKPDGLGKGIAVLPGEVPVGDVNERDLFAVGQHGPAFERLADVVGVRTRRVEINRRRQREFLADSKFRFAGRYVNVRAFAERRRKLDRYALTGRGLVGEVNGYGGYVGFDLSRRVVVRLEDEVGVWR